MAVNLGILFIGAGIRPKTVSSWELSKSDWKSSIYKRTTRAAQLNSTRLKPRHVNYGFQLDTSIYCSEGRKNVHNKPRNKNITFGFEISKKYLRWKMNIFPNDKKKSLFHFRAFQSNATKSIFQQQNKTLYFSTLVALLWTAVSGKKRFKVFLFSLFVWLKRKISSALYQENARQYRIETTRGISQWQPAKISHFAQQLKVIKHTLKSGLELTPFVRRPWISFPISGNGAYNHSCINMFVSQHS